jgi:hypothetical protein
MECEEKYRTIKSLSRTLQENPWDKHLRIKVYKLKKDFNKLTRKKYRLYRNVLIDKIVESEKNDPNDTSRQESTTKSFCILALNKISLFLFHIIGFRIGLCKLDNGPRSL